MWGRFNGSGFISHAQSKFLLNGIFDTLFPETGLVFDAQRYSFIEPNDVTKNITLWAQSSDLYGITGKVLVRNGFTVIECEREKAEILAECIDNRNSWILTTHKQTVTSLYELARLFYILK